MSRQYWKGTDVTSEMNNDDILVFGSNPEGRHGKGLAQIALRNFGAKYRKGRGLYGNSYALVTKNLRKNFTEVLPNGTELKYTRAGYGSVRLSWISDNLEELLKIVKDNPQRKFFFPYVKQAKNLNGCSSSRLVRMLVRKGIPSNLILSETFKT